MSGRRDVLGRGWAFPFHFEKTGRVAQAADVDLVKMAIRQIIGTRVGARIVFRTFGSRLRDLIFEPINDHVDVLVEHGVRDSLLRWERRTVPGPVVVDKAERMSGRLDIGVTFRVTRTSTVENLVFPFFLSPSDQARVGIGPGNVS